VELSLLMDQALSDNVLKITSTDNKWSK